MPGLHTQHPDRENLTAFGLGRLSEADSKAVETHVVDCEECRKKLEDLPADSLVSLLQAPTPDTFSDSNARGDTSDIQAPMPAPAQGESLPPLYKKLASILVEQDGAQPPASPALEKGKPSLSSPSGFAIPKELEAHSRYEVVAPLGAGGMGTVYKAQHRMMDRFVAIKIVNPTLVTRAGAVDRFEREVRAAAQLVHPNIVTAYDAEKVGGMHLLVMEYVEGQTLAQTLHEKRFIPVATACEYLRQTAVGLQYALERGMVHRDIKPQNLMLTSKGEVKILDFGLARFVSEQAPADDTNDPGTPMKGSAGRSTQHGTLMGSPDYMAPEQAIDAHSADSRADIYGMGCTLYHLLAEQVPFPASTLVERLTAHRDQTAIPLHHIRPDVPVELTNIVAKMMAKDPTQRYQTPGEVAAALAPFTQANATAPKAQSRQALGSRKPLIAAAIIAAALLLGVGYWLAQIVLRVDTPYGTLIVKTDDPDVQISVKSGGKEVALFFPMHKLELPLKIGEYTIELVNAKPGMKLTANKFEIKTANDKQVVTVEFTPRPVDSKKSPEPLDFPFTAKVGQKRQQEWAAFLKRKVVETNSLGMQLALIPPGGDFEMGEEYKVRLTKPFYLGAHAVTVGQFRKFVEATGYVTDAQRPESGGGFLVDDKGAPANPKREHNWTNKTFSPTDQHPAVFLSWTDAVSFCNWVSRQEKKNYRLTTEAEWEWAARGGGPLDGKAIEARGWFAPKSGQKSQPVGKLPADAFGLFDMFGNVHNFCQDWIRDFPKESASDPTGPTSGHSKVVRGGTFMHGPLPGGRWSYDQIFSTQSGGFRVVCEADFDRYVDPALPNIPSVEELLKSRNVLIVDKDAKVGFRTIDEALKKVQANEVIQVKGKGPYRETLDGNLPPNVALVSLDGARIEVAKYAKDEQNQYWAAGLFTNTSFRMSGLTWVSVNEPRDSYFYLLNLWGRDVIVDNCSFEGPFPGNSIAMICRNGTDQPGKVHLYNNYFGGRIIAGFTQDHLTIERNWFAQSSARTELHSHQSGSITFRHNIVQHFEGPRVHLLPRDKEKAQPGVDILFHNNVFDVTDCPLGFWLIGPEPNVLRPRSLTVANNVVRSRRSQGVWVYQDPMKKMGGNWQVGPNAYADKPKSGQLKDADVFGVAWPTGANDRMPEKLFLSSDPQDSANYLRIPATGDLATKGADGNLPKYFGAFLPGPAPKDGDWFTRMLADKKALLQVDTKPRRQLRDIVDLSKARLLANEDFVDPKKSAFGWGDFERHFKNGRIFLYDGEAPLWSSGGFRFADFVCEARGTIVASPHRGWGLGVLADPHQKGGVEIFLNSQGELHIIPNRIIKDPAVEIAAVGPIRVPNFNQGGQKNVLAVIVRGGTTLEIFVNGVEACEPVKLKSQISPAVLSLTSLGGDKGSVLAFEGLKVWSILPPPTVKELLDQANAAVAQKQFDQAVALCTEILGREPNHIAALHARAWPQWNLGRRELAIQDVSAVLKLDPNHHDARHNRTYYFLHTGRHDECIADATLFLSQHKSSRDAYAALEYRGVAWAYKGRFDKALSDFEAGLQLNPKHGRARYWQGIIFERLGDHAKAKAAYEKSFPAPNPNLLADVVPQPLPLDEYLQGRTILTVRQDGKAMFTTIQKAMEEVKSGQVIEVLDKGPYRESFIGKVPDNVGLVSKVGTRIEIPKWHVWNTKEPDKKKHIYQGMVWHSSRGFRLTGFELVCPEFPADFAFAIAVELAAAGEIVVESCRILRTPREAADAPSPQYKEHEFYSLRIGADDAGTTRYVVRDNLLEGSVDFVRGTHPDVLMERNRVVAPVSIGIRVVHVAAGLTVIRHNVILAHYGFLLGPHNIQAGNKARYLIANNVLDVMNTPGWAWSPMEKDKVVLPLTVRIQNNIMHSRNKEGFHLVGPDQQLGKTKWQVQQNCFLAEPVSRVEAMPRLPNNLVAPNAFLSLDPRHADYLRIDANGPLATSGVSDNMPPYIGAFPPGPAPKEGDWFSRLRQEPAGKK